MTALPNPTLEVCAIVDHATPGDRANRRKPGRWKRTLKRQALWLLRRDINGWLGACVVVMALVVAQTLITLNEERAARLDAEAKVRSNERAEKVREIESASWNCSEMGYKKREGRYCWRQKRIGGDS